jgi:hypothetical protein
MSRHDPTQPPPTRVRSARRAADGQDPLCQSRSPVLAVIDKWLYEPAIRRTGLVVVLALLAAVVAIAVAAGPSGIALLVAVGLSASLRRATYHRPDEPTENS